MSISRKVDLSPNKFLFALAFLSVCSILIFSQTAKAQSDASLPPMHTVETMVSSVLAILRDDTLPTEESATSIKEALFKGFDSRAMAQSVLSTNWRQASKEQQTEFEALFLQTLESTYIDRIEAYTDEKVEFLGEDINKKRSTVETIIVTSNNNIPVDYRLRLRSDGWFIYDVVVENVSMISAYRDDYRSVVKRSGIDELLVQMRKKVNELESKPF